MSMLETEGVQLRFTRNAVKAIAHFAATVNASSQDIGARRLHTIMEALMEDISFRAPEMGVEQIVIDADYVQGQLAEIVQDEDLSRYIL